MREQRILALGILAMLFIPARGSSDLCPVMLLSGTVEQNTLTITFRNDGKSPIRTLEFNCNQVDAEADKLNHIHCIEEKAHFLPGSENTVRYNGLDFKPVPVLLSVKRITFSDGSNWKPSKHTSCQALKVRPETK